MRDWTGPLSLCNFVLEKTGAFSSFFLRSVLVRGLDLFGVVNFYRGTSSPLCDRSLHPGYLIGDGFILDCFSPFSSRVPGLLTEGPGIWVLTDNYLLLSLR